MLAPQSCRGLSEPTQENAPTTGAINKPKGSERQQRPSRSGPWPIFSHKGPESQCFWLTGCICRLLLIILQQCKHWLSPGTVQTGSVLESAAGSPERVNIYSVLHSKSLTDLGILLSLRSKPPLLPILSLTGQGQQWSPDRFQGNTSPLLPLQELITGINPGSAFHRMSDLWGLQRISC